MVTIAEYLSNPALIVRKLRWLSSYKRAPHQVTLRTFNGLLTFDSRDRIIGRQLFIRHGFEEDWIRAATEALRSEGLLDGTGTILDVGANIGMIGTALLLHDHCKRVIAFEPEPRNYALLQHNIAQNSLSERLEAHQLALSSEPGEMELELSTYNSGDHRLRMAQSGGRFDEDRREVVRVPVARLDDLVSQRTADFQDTRAIWLDIQGHEAHFMRGARELLGRGLPLVSEFWPYGILRSGVSRDEYVAEVARSYTRALVQDGKSLRTLTPDDLADLFSRMDRHTDMRQMILLD